MMTNNSFFSKAALTLFSVFIGNAAISQTLVSGQQNDGRIPTPTMLFMNVTPDARSAGMGDAGPCHPRDNIALRWLAERLNLGYDIFDTVMKAREQQAYNLAKFLKDLQTRHSLPVIIHGKAYKPDVDYVDGSYSLLIVSYLDQLKAEYYYWDPLTGDRLPEVVPAIVLLAHNRKITYGYTGELPEQQLYFNLSGGSIVVDPWRTFTTEADNIQVIHYGNTRK